MKERERREEREKERVKRDSEREERQTEIILYSSNWGSIPSNMVPKPHQEHKARSKP